VIILRTGTIIIRRNPATFGGKPFSLVARNLMNGYLTKVLKSKKLLAK
jgi:hypothetical protein